METPHDKKRKPTSPAGASTPPAKFRSLGRQIYPSVTTSRQETQPPSTQPPSPKSLARSTANGQVYAAVRDPKTGNFITGKKNVHGGNTKKLLNGFGQYCLPGGKLEDKDKTLADGAIREFREETGIDLTTYEERLGEPKAYVISADPESQAHLVVLDVAFRDKSIDGLRNKISGNLKLDAEQKKNLNIHPELAEVQVTSPKTVSSRLGRRQEVKDPYTQKIIPPRVGYKDSIDWYEKMGEKMKELASGDGSKGNDVEDQRLEGGSRMGEADSAVQSTSTQSTSTQSTSTQ